MSIFDACPTFWDYLFSTCRAAFGFAGKLNLRQSMALRIRRVSRVANAPQPNAKATSTNRAGPRLRLRLSLSSRPVSRARPWARSQLRHLAIHYAQLRHPRRQRLRCLRCLQQRAAQRRLIASGCASVWVCVCVRHAPRLLATLGLRPPAFYPLELDSSAAALYAHGVFIKVVFILRDIFGASFALFLWVCFFFVF